MKTKRTKKLLRLKPLTTLEHYGETQARRAFALWFKGETIYSTGLYLDVVDSHGRIDKSKTASLIDAGRYLAQQAA